MKIALVHDWLTGMRGGERCLEVFCELFPDADLYTLLHIPGRVSRRIESMRIHTSFLQHLPAVQTHYRHYLPLMPLAVSRWRLSGYDLVLSSSHCVAKGVRVDPGTPHLCYCFTPMRYMWDRFEDYFGPGRAGRLTRFLARQLRSPMLDWDLRSNAGVSLFVAISHYVQERIRRFYGRESTVLYPPVNTGFFRPEGAAREDFFLMVSALAPYKRVDLAVEAFNELGYPLRILGEGQDGGTLRRRARPNIRFLGRLSDSEVRSHYDRCRALVFPGVEDFGITPLEAQAMGAPVIALAQGGALETVIPDEQSWRAETGCPRELAARPTGVFFHQPTPEALITAVRHFESIEDRFDAGFLRQHACAFDTRVFTRRIEACVRETLDEIGHAEKI